ncbi:uncharacterized protein EV154DRAFT_551843 [Mucor mucedo]|uniref:uncharacterized protein n=1 Tax=Mucor mucedo TaxID=29922 RepID=UPI00221EBECE|nr:uncharacterized protein EV154DRAFT_481618 [Mucor mucedo]XP_051457384.1 uncharacterized protein EV154DRAFT_551843 [Mucor mucedo]KAI7890967.1 hypothetical protein EV154DRAFT_481618 [Mucor mucedo]KAI7890968.1 hypothetical protein EV154DRAFT_551843 [Mucor mucedo]
MGTPFFGTRVVPLKRARFFTSGSVLAFIDPNFVRGCYMSGEAGPSEGRNNSMGTPFFGTRVVPLKRARFFTSGSVLAFIDPNFVRGCYMSGEAGPSEGRNNVVHLVYDTKTSISQWEHRSLGQE